jgi:hypothetical protein
VQLALVEGGDEVLGLAQRRCLERGDHHERGALVAQRLGDRIGALHEPWRHGLEQREELGDVLEELRAQDPIGHRVEGLGRQVHRPATSTAR